MIVLVALCGLAVGAALLAVSRRLPGLIAAKPAPLAPAALPGLTTATLALSVAAAVWLWLQVGPTLDALLLGLVFAFMGLVTLVDLQYRLIPNALTYPAIVLALGWRVAAGDARGALIGGVFAFAIFYLTARLQPGKLGGGDVKLATLIGIFFGFPGALWVLLIGVGVGAIAAVLLLVRSHSRLRTIPYAPFLCIGAVVWLVCNPSAFLSLGL